MHSKRLIVSIGSVAAASLSPAAAGGGAATASAAATYPSASAAAPFGVTHGKGGYLADVDAVSSTDVWAVGSYYPRGGSTHGLVQHWDGLKWTNTALSAVDDVDNLAAVSVVSPTDVWAVGRSYDDYEHMATLVQHWDGATWTHMPSPSPPGDGGGAEFNDVVALSDTDVWAVGALDPQSLEWRRCLIEHWNGVRWKQLDCPHPGVPTGASLSSLSFTSPTDGWAVGYYEQSYGKHLAFIEHWNGKAWSWTDPHVPTGKYWKDLSAVVAIAPDDAWAAGVNTLNGTLIEHWDGQSWTLVDDSAPGHWSAISALDATSASDVWAVGAFTDPRGLDETLVEHWDGTTWTQLPPFHAPGRESWLGGVRALTDHDVWMVGSMSRQTPSPHDRELSGHWDGSTWRWF